MIAFSCRRAALAAAVIGAMLCSIKTSHAQTSEIQAETDRKLEAERRARDKLVVEQRAKADQEKLEAEKRLRLAEEVDATLKEQDALRLYARRTVLAFHHTGNEILGATLLPISDAWRSQLNIPKGQGVLVESVKSEGSSDLAGLKPNDILLAIGEIAIASDEDLIKSLKAADKTALPLKLLRAGKTVTIQVRPINLVTIGPAVEQKMEYYIGVSIDPVADALRSQLALPAGHGIVVTDVIRGSPAEEAGVKKYDIILSLDNKTIGDPEKLKQHVQAAAAKPLKIKLLRAGSPLTIEVLPALRKADNSPLSNDLNPPIPLRKVVARKVRDADAIVEAIPIQRTESVEDLQSKLERLEAEREALRVLLEKIKQSEKTKKP